MAIKKLFYTGSDKWKTRASDIINALIDGGGGGGGNFVPLSRKINNKTLETDITLNANDVNAIPNTVNVATLSEDNKLVRSQLPYFSVVDGKLCITFEA